MASNEYDPLLPRNKPTPEIQFSRPQSINDDVDQELWKRNHKEAQSRTSTLALIMGLITLAFFTILVFPDGFQSIWGDSPWSPKTIDESVNSILARTPLI